MSVDNLLPVAETELSAARPLPARARRAEKIGFFACMVLYAALRLWGLRREVINDKFDEGVYLSLMQAVAAGKGALYRDFILCHPPGVLWAGTALWPHVHGSVYALRLLTIGFCALALLPMVALARRFYGDRAALVTLFLLATSPGFANWLGREVLLDPPLNVPLYLALWMLISTPRFRIGAAIGAGALLGMSFLIKETALPAALAVCVALAVVSSQESSLRISRESSLRSDTAERWAWLWFGATFLLACGLVLACLARIPNYLHYTFTFNANDVREWRHYPKELLNGFYALPFPLTFGLLGTIRMARRRSDRAGQFLGIYALTMLLIMLVVPKTFYWRYLLPALPVLCLGVWVWFRDFFSVPHSAAQRRAVIALTSLFGLVHIAGLILYRTHESVLPPAYDTAVHVLRARPGPLFTLDPIWAVASAHPLTPGVQQLIKATSHLPVTANDYETVLTRCPTVLLNAEAMRWLPNETVRRIRARYRSVFRYATPGDSHYVEVLGSPGPNPPAPFPKTLVPRWEGGEAPTPGPSPRTGEGS